MELVAVGMMPYFLEDNLEAPTDVSDIWIAEFFEVGSIVTATTAIVTARNRL